MARLRARFVSLLVLLVLTSALPAAAIVPPRGSALADRAFTRPDLVIRNYVVPIAQVPPSLQPALREAALRLQVTGGAALYDRRARRFGTLVLATPLVPGAGLGNLLDWASRGGAPADDGAYQAALWNALTGYLAAHAADLRLDAAQFGTPRITLHEDRRVAQIYIPRVVDGVAVRDSFALAVVNSGNLVLVGTRNWGDVAASTQPAISAAQASDNVRAFAAPFAIESFWKKHELQLVPAARGADPAQVEPGQGLDYRLAWAVRPRFAGDRGSYEALVDAQTGEVLAFADRNQYAESRAIGGVFPVSNDGQVPDGVEHPGFPMPFADVTTGGATSFANAHGLFTAAGHAETTLSGKYVQINDECGPILEPNFCSSDLDLASGAGHDCAVPFGHSAGDTHAARSGFYELNRIIAQAQAYLPGNAWLQEQLPANMNINDFCNAFWNGSSVNFYRSGGGCANTGEIAAVFDHEWGHGLDNNDTIPEISSPGEAYADIAAFYRLNNSCVARGLFLSGTCDGEGDPCTECTGVREADFAKRASGRPHDIDWVLGLSDVPGGCPIGVQVGPCGLETHCEGEIVGETMWDLYARDLQGFAGSPVDLDPNTALEVATRLFYLGAGTINSWYQCVGGGTDLGGCNPDGGYLNLLMVDDDNGSLADGTPHMEAIFRAFDRHQLACGLLPPQTGGCALSPQTAPTVSAVAGLRSAQISWNAVAGATAYWVYRTEGVFGFDFGKQRIGITSGTTFADEGLLDGFTYYYGVLPVGAGTCLGPMSAGVAVVPQGPPAPPTQPQAALRIDEGSGSFVPATGDGDDFADNCERGELRFTVRNAGNVPLTNLRIVAAHSPSHPETIVTSMLPKTVTASLPSTCANTPGEAAAALEFVAGGVAPGEGIAFAIELTADEIAPATVAGTLTLDAAEADWVGVAQRTYTFETDLEGWQVVEGTFDRVTVPTQGAQGSSSFLASSTAMSLQCDEIRSPVLRLTPTSTLALYTQYSTEPESTQWFDRANLAIFDQGTGERRVVSPDGGRLYPASGGGGQCVTGGLPGWATNPAGDTGLGWAVSTFSAEALGGAAASGRRVALDVAYGTDSNLEGTGFWFDEVTLTDVETPGADAQSDVCPLVCEQVDDGSPAVEYSGGWHRVDDAAASNGGYHRRMGAKAGGAAPVARVVFTGPEITYEFARSSQGGSADVYLDGVLRETISYASPTASPSFGHAVTYGGLGEGTHELRIVHRSGAVYVDGFRLDCTRGGASAEAVRSRSVTQASTASAGEGPVIRRSVAVGAGDLEVSVVVEGSPVALGVKLLDPAGNLLATGSALLPGLTATGLDAAVNASGTYTVEILNALPPLGTARISIARTVRVE